MRSTITAILILGVLSYGSWAHAGGCKKLDCTGDGDAWAAALGDAPAQKDEQAAERAAVGDFLQQRAAQTQATHAAELSGLPLAKRLKLLFSLDDSLTRLTNAPVSIIHAYVVAVGESYVFCGSAYYGGPSDEGVFVFDTGSPPKLFTHASVEQFAQAGCGGDSTALR